MNQYPKSSKSSNALVIPWRIHRYPSSQEELWLCVVFKSFYKGEKKQCASWKSNPFPQLYHPSKGVSGSLFAPLPSQHCGSWIPPKKTWFIPRLVQTPVYLCPGGGGSGSAKITVPRWSVPSPAARAPGTTYLCTSPGHPRRPGGTPAPPRTGKRLGRGTPPCWSLSKRWLANSPLSLGTLDSI